MMKDDTSRKPVVKSFLAVSSEAREARKCWSLLDGLGKRPSLDDQPQVGSCAFRAPSYSFSARVLPFKAAGLLLRKRKRPMSIPRRGRTLGPHFSVPTSHWASENPKYSRGNESQFPSDTKERPAPWDSVLRAELGLFRLNRGRAQEFHEYNFPLSRL